MGDQNLMAGSIFIANPPAVNDLTGSDVDRVIGTGAAFPAFPGYLQYNGLLLNNYKQYDYFHINSIDGIDDAEIRDNRAVKPNEDGEDDYGSYYAGRSIVINGEIRAYHLWKADDMRGALQRIFARKNEELPLWFRLGDPDKDRIIYCKKSAKLEIPNSQPTRAMPWVPFMIPLRAKDPRMHSYLLHSVDENVGSFLVPNKGNYDAKPKIRFYGPATSMRLTRFYDDIAQTIDVGSIATGDYVEIEGVRVIDSSGANAYNRYSDDSDAITLGPEPLLNYFDLSGTGLGASSSVFIQWRDAWI